MKHGMLAMVLVFAGLPIQAMAMCYTVLDRNGGVVWRGGNTPIDLSKQVSQGIRGTFPPGSFLVISEANPGCTPIGPQDIFGPMPGLTGPIPGVSGMASGLTAGRPAP